MGSNSFWNFGDGRGTLWLAPVTITNPAAATAFFEANTGQEWEYEFIGNNCKNYVCWGLSGSSITGQGGTTDFYVDASLHEIGHAFFGFDHDGMGNGLGISGSAPSVMDYRYAYSGMGFNAQELNVVGSSIYGGH